MNLFWLKFIRKQEVTTEFPLLQAHRGYWFEGLQENTFDAFIEAKKRGYGMIEFDVQLSKDQIPIVFHDKDLVRLAQKKLFVADLTAGELAEFAKVPTLEDVLLSDLVPHYLNLEIKSAFPGNGHLERQIAQVIQKTQSQGRIVISSFNPVSLMRMQYYCPSIPRALLAADDEQQLWCSPFLKVAWVHLNYRAYNEDVIRNLKLKGIKLAAWTVNEAATAKTLLHRGLNSIISDQVRPQDI